MVYQEKNSKTRNFFSQLSERDTDFMIGNGNLDVQSQNIESVAHRAFSSNNTNNLTQVNYPRVDTHTLEEKIVNVRSEMDNVMKMVETRVQDAVSTAIENLVTATVELTMKSANASSDGVFAVMYWSQIREFFRVLSKTYK